MNTQATFYPSVSRLLGAPLTSAWLAADSGDCFHVDIEETDQAYHILADLPGVGKDDVEVNVEDGVLTISAQFARGESSGSKALRRERMSGRVRRRFALSPQVQADSISAALENGVLKLTLRKEETTRRRRIDIA